MPVSPDEWNTGIIEAKQDALIAEQYGDAAATAYCWLRSHPYAYTVGEILHNAFDTGPQMVGHITTTDDGTTETNIVDRTDAHAAAEDDLETVLDQLVADELLAARDIHTTNGVERHYRHIERDLRDILGDDAREE